MEERRRMETEARWDEDGGIRKEIKDKGSVEKEARCEWDDR